MLFLHYFKNQFFACTVHGWYQADWPNTNHRGVCFVLNYSLVTMIIHGSLDFLLLP